VPIVLDGLDFGVGDLGEEKRIWRRIRIVQMDIAIQEVRVRFRLDWVGKDIPVILVC